jgi:hypothetical protein
LGTDEVTALEGEGEAIVDESENLEVENVEEGKVEIAPETMVEEIEIETNDETVLDAEETSEPQIEETIIKVDSMNLDEVQEAEIAVDGDIQEEVEPWRPKKLPRFQKMLSMMLQ